MYGLPEYPTASARWSSVKKKRTFGLSAAANMAKKRTAVARAIRVRWSDRELLVESLIAE
jgi:hypothetical protein